MSGRIRSGENLVHSSTGRLAMRGGMREALRVTGASVTELLGVYQWSPTGGLVIGHAPSTPKHYIYAITELGGFALPAGTPTETGSRDDLDWNTATPVWAHSEELFETLFLVDPAQSQGMRSVKLSGGSVVVAPVEADLDGDTTPGVLKPKGLFSFNSVLFAYGWEDEVVGVSPEVLRHSLLGQDPAAAVGWDKDAFALIGNKGQAITAGSAGQGSALVAKRSGLWRITGTPDALPGWQFAIQAVDNSQGYGCVNPHSLCYAFGRWWGIGRTGPWMSDGGPPMSLVGARRERWGQVSNLDETAWVAAHPTREAILFGFSEPASALAGARTSRIWVFDTRADRWAPDFTFPTRFYRAAAIEQTGIALSDTPQDLLWVSNAEAVESNAFSLKFTLGDSSALTEVWVQEPGGPSQLAETLAAGLGGTRIAQLNGSALVPATAYQVRVRHRRGDSVTEFSDTVTMYTRPAAPRVVGIGTTFSQPPSFGLGVGLVNVPVPADFTVTVPRSGIDLAWTCSNAYEPGPSQPTETLSQVVAGAVTINILTDRAQGAAADPTSNPRLSLRSTLDAQVATHAVAARFAPSLALRFGSNTYPTGGVIYQYVFDAFQQLDDALVTENSVALVVTMNRGIMSAYTAQFNSVFVRLRQLDGGSATYDSALQPLTASSLVQFHTITGLPSSTRFEVQLFIGGFNNGGFNTLLRVGSTDNPPIAYTRIGRPTATAVATGTVSPKVEITVTPPGGRTGFDTLIANADRSFDALYSAVAGTATTYESTAGVDGRPDRYFVRSRSTAWPAGFQYSDPVVLNIEDPQP